MAKPKEKDESQAPPPASQQTGGTALVNYGEYAGSGFENTDQSELRVPFLRILDVKSPQVEEGNAAYIPGAKAGMIYNTGTGEVYPREPGIIFIPAHRDHNYVEWVPMDKGGGFVAIWELDDPSIASLRKAQGRFGKLKTDAEGSTEVAETFYFYGVAVPPGGEPFQCVIGFSSTQIKKYQMMYTRLVAMAGSPPKFPLFAHRWRLSTQVEAKKNFKWQGWVCTLDGKSPEEARMRPDDPLFLMAADFNKAVRSGAVKADYERAGAEPGADDGDDIPTDM